MAEHDGMAPIKVPSNLPELVRAAFKRACASGDVHFFPTEVAVLNVNSVPFQLRFSPALANKPQTPQPPAPGTTHYLTDKQQQDDTSSTHSPDTQTGTSNTKTSPIPGKKPFFDPFDNPPQAMLVAPLPPSHILVLNKFAIVPEHFILATRAFKHQTHLLEQDDLDAAYACVLAYEGYTPGQDGLGQKHRQGQDTTEDGTDKSSSDAQQGLYVFFNSGAASGSSQPHRHIQLLPVARMREGLEDHRPGQTWDVLARILLRDELRARLPFQTFAEPIGPGADLAAAYKRLYRQAVEAVLGSAAAAAAEEGTESGEGGMEEGTEAKVDYNLAMTRDVMVIAPRVAEGEAVSAVGEDGTRREVGKLALNGTVLAGTALVKHREEWDALRAEPEQLVKLLGRIGVPPVHAPSLV